MELVKARATQTNTSMTANFLGYNHNANISDGEFYDMKNLTSDFYPMLAPRRKRGLVAELTNCTALAATDNLYWCDDNKFYYNTHYICDLIESETKHFVQMGAYVCIFPDNIAYNTYTEELIHLDAEFTSEYNPVLSLCKMDGTVYDSDHLWIGDTEPEDREEYPTWLDTSSNPSVLKIWSINESQWVSVPTTYVKIYSPGIGELFNEDDAIFISGCDIEDFNTSMIIIAKDTDYIVVIGLLEEGVHINRRQMTFKRSVPQMDYVCELNNRLYGCSSENHEIYVCKQGDPKNWNYFGGLASDSYAATVGTDGKFTGCIAHLGYVLFFKERGVHKLYGNTPASFSLSWQELRGVQEGSERSLVVLNECLFYKSTSCICMYDGSLPRDISSVFGTEQYFDAVGGKFGNKYYISMRDRSYNWYLFVYDTDKRLWHKEDNVKAAGFANYDGSLYMCDQYQKMWVFPIETMNTYLFPDMYWDDAYYYPSENIYPDYAVEGVYEDDIVWEAETGDIGFNNPYHKYISRLILRLEMDEDSEFYVKIMYDSSGEWEDLFNLIADCKRSYNVPLRVTRCDHFRLKLGGIGNMKLYSITKTIETGSEL